VTGDGQRYDARAGHPCRRQERGAWLSDEANDWGSRSGPIPWTSACGRTPGRHHEGHHGCRLRGQVPVHHQAVQRPDQDFCMNPYGEVVRENSDGRVQRQRPQLQGTEGPRTPISPCWSARTSPGPSMNHCLRQIYRRPGEPPGGGVLVQRLGDLKMAAAQRPSGSPRVPSVPRSPTPRRRPELRRFPRHLAAILRDARGPGQCGSRRELGRHAAVRVEVKVLLPAVEADADARDGDQEPLCVGDGAGVTRGLISLPFQASWLRERS